MLLESYSGSSYLHIFLKVYSLCLLLAVLKRITTNGSILKIAQKKATLVYYLIPVRMAIVKKTDDNRCRLGCVRKKSLFNAGSNIN